MIFISLLIVFASCKKKSEEPGSPGLSEEDQAYYENIVSLQENAVNNYIEWLKSMDSLQAINQLQQFFLADPSVKSAIISEQGICVQYTNGICGGVVLNTLRPKSREGLNLSNSSLSPCANSKVKSLVNKKKMIYLSPCYWDKKSISTDPVLAMYYNALPKVGFDNPLFYKNVEVTLDLLTSLSGYGIIHIDAHGLRFDAGEPNPELPRDNYFITGEALNQKTTDKYWEDLKNGNIGIPELCNIGEVPDQNKFLKSYWASTKFLAAHNDFSKDTVLFMAMYCNSRSQWTDRFRANFAKLAHVCFFNSVCDTNCHIWATSLIDSLCDTTARPHYSTGRWLSGPYPPKHQFGDNIFIRGDQDLSLWKEMEIETSPITNITQTTATGGGNLKSDNGFPVTSKGICWSTSANPTIANNKTSDGSGIGVFESNLTNLTANTLYYVRAYATNNQGKTFYGNLVSFTTQQQGGQTVTDFDGNVYNLVTIGTQVWLVENLKTTHYSNGDPVPNLTKNADWSETNDGAWCDNNNNGNNGQIYGHLYNWRAAADPRNLCPNGWHVPSDAEWTVLDDFLLWHVGGKMKEAGTAHWVSPNTGATNESGFTALPAGSRTYGGLFNEPGYAAEFWSSTISPDPTYAYIRSLLYDDDFMYSNEVWIEAGFSVRCLKN